MAQRSLTLEIDCFLDDSLRPTLRGGGLQLMHGNLIYDTPLFPYFDRPELLRGSVLVKDRFMGEKAFYPALEF